MSRAGGWMLKGPDCGWPPCSHHHHHPHPHPDPPALTLTLALRHTFPHICPTPSHCTPHPPHLQSTSSPLVPLSPPLSCRTLKPPPPSCRTLKPPPPSCRTRPSMPPRILCWPLQPMGMSARRPRTALRGPVAGTWGRQRQAVTPCQRGGRRLHLRQSRRRRGRLLWRSRQRGGPLWRSRQRGGML